MTSDVNIYRIAEDLKASERKVLDFSSPVNPLGTSKKVKAELRKRLKYLSWRPDGECRRMKRQVALRTGVEAGMILCWRDAVEMTLAIIDVLESSRVLSVSPGSIVYEKTLTRHLPRVSMVKRIPLDTGRGFKLTVEEFIRAMEDCDVAVLNNPNDVSGTVLPVEDVTTIAKAAEKQGCLLIVDETFLDFTDEQPAAALVASHKNLAVMKSLGEYHALTGLGVGYGVFHPDLAGLLEKEGRWSRPDLLAQSAVGIALRDKAYRKETARVVAEEKAFIEDRMKKLGVETIPSGTNFFLVRLERPDDCAAYLLKRRVVLASCEQMAGLGKGWFRVAVKDHRSNAHLMKALKEFYGQGS